MKKILFLITTLCCFICMLTPSFGADILITMPPEFEPARNADGTPLYYSESEIEQLFRTYSKNLKKVLYNHNIKKFIVPDSNWVYELIDVYEEYLHQQRIRPQRDTWDCENYSTLLNSFASIRLWRAGFTNTRLALGWMRVKAKHPWAGIPDAIHALVFTVTTQGILVIEPQNGQTILLSEYPNRTFIEEIYLF